ncbi:MAG: Holliday junction DNA helicase RuvA [Bacteroidetes bacterium GWF2_38_335]|nr:MAG: Holliday junction DNA helicase RuvA [Bacteroidetes bacterium GWF2_38_335]OFY79717.1 MAG: Holliday junction DNA helicase RuvA [Bacteroidetes bacterium RIFOXYA12_FULL_38_20]HBS87577.1 Holliday junction branch migration protein RuvA [Bacteroidales bacterium]
MFEYIQGKITEATPTYIVLENNGIGYFINISVNTYASFKTNETIKIFIHQVIREDAHLFYGFISKKEREIFRSLISVSGVGAATARMILSSMTPDQIQKAIMSGNVAALQAVKGIGAKSAQRIIIDLRDKVGGLADEADLDLYPQSENRKEALSALTMLGFQKNAVEKVLEKIIAEDNNLSVEELVKKALKKL